MNSVSTPGSTSEHVIRSQLMLKEALQNLQQDDDDIILHDSTLRISETSDFISPLLQQNCISNDDSPNFQFLPSSPSLSLLLSHHAWNVSSSSASINQQSQTRDSLEHLYDDNDMTPHQSMETLHQVEFTPYHSFAFPITSSLSHSKSLIKALDDFQDAADIGDSRWNSPAVAPLVSLDEIDPIISSNEDSPSPPNAVEEVISENCQAKPSPPPARCHSALNGPIESSSIASSSSCLTPSSSYDTAIFRRGSIGMTTPHLVHDPYQYDLDLDPNSYFLSRYGRQRFEKSSDDMDDATSCCSSYSSSLSYVPSTSSFQGSSYDNSSSCAGSIYQLPFVNGNDLEDSDDDDDLVEKGAVQSSLHPMGNSTNTLKEMRRSGTLSPLDTEHHSDEASRRTLSPREPETDPFGFEGGPYATDFEKFQKSMVSPHILLARELKWRCMLENWTKWEQHKHKIVERCRKSIPRSMRGEAWQCLVGSPLARERHNAHIRDMKEQKKAVEKQRKAQRRMSKKNSLASLSRRSSVITSEAVIDEVIPLQCEENKVTTRYEGIYRDYLSRPSNPIDVAQIRLDIAREFQDHCLLKKNAKRYEAFFNVLIAYTVRTGRSYTQGQSCLAGVLLMFMDEMDAFWTFTQICEEERYLGGIFHEDLVNVRVAVKALLAFVKRHSPSAYTYLDSIDINPTGILMPWFMSCYIRQIKWFPSLLNVLDMFFCEGKKVLYKLGVYIISALYGTKSLQKRNDPEGDLKLLREIPDSLLREDVLVKEICAVSISDTELQNELHRQKKHFLEARSI